MAATKQTVKSKPATSKRAPTSAAAASVAATLSCPECGKSFTRAAALGAHRKMTHGVAGSSANATSNRARVASKKRTTISTAPQHRQRGDKRRHHGRLTVMRCCARFSPTASRPAKMWSAPSTNGSTKQNDSPAPAKPTPHLSRASSANGGRASPRPRPLKKMAGASHTSAATPPTLAVVRHLRQANHHCQA